MSDCVPPSGVQALTLPSSSMRIYFCAASGSGVLTYVINPRRCTSSQLSLVVWALPHQPPTLGNVEPGTLQYDAGTPAVHITSSLTVSVPVVESLVGATVKISSGFAPGEDSLSFISQNGITGSYDSGTGVLTLTGTTSLPNYQAALRSVTFSDPNGATPTTGTRAISFQVSDSRTPNNLSNVVSRAIMVNPNSPPTAVADSAATDKNTAINIPVLANDSDPDGDALSVASVDTTGTKGSVSINPDGTIHYDPNGQFQGLGQGQTATDTFTYKASDGYQTSNSAMVSVTINGVTVPPVVANVESSALSYREQDPAVQVTSTLTLSDADDATMSGATVSITSGFSSAADALLFTNQNGITGSYDATTGVLTLSGSAAIGDYQTALRSVQFFTSDASASPAARTVSFIVTDSLGATSAPAQRTINVGQANQPPIAINHSYTAVGNTPLGVGTSPAAPAVTVSGSVLTGDSDPDSADPISLTGHTNPTSGTLSMNPDGTFTYTPNAGFSGTDSFTYTITDSDDPGRPLSATATVNITVGPVVWYVDNSKAAAGDGRSASPFNTLAAANSAAGPGSIIFLYQGNATYTGGVTMQSGEALLGQPNGLTVGSYSLVPPGGSAPTITNSGGNGINLAENADVEGVNITSPSGNGVAASGVSDATVGGSTAVAISGAGGDGIHVSGGSGNLDFAKTSVTGSAAHSLSLASHTGGTASFGGNITDHGTGISLAGNSGATVSLGGTLTVSTGANPAFSATGGGAITATGSGSTLTTSTGTALNIQGTTIGAAGLKFQAISSNGASPGISLGSTGTSGGLTVSGTGSAGTGGTIQNSTGEGVQLSSTTSPSFTDMVIQNNAADGINGSLVNGLTLVGSTVSGNGTQANVSGQNDDGLDFSPNGTGSPNGLTGTVSISNSVITGSADNNAVISDTSGTLNLTVTGSTFSNNNSVTGNDGLHVDASGTTNATVSVTGSTFTNNFGDHFQFSTDSASSGTNSVTFSSNTLNSTVSGVLGGGVVISPFGNSHTSITIDANNIQNAVSNGIGIDEADTTGTAGTLSGTVHGNTIGTPTVSNSGGGNGIGIFAEGSVTETLAITGNNLYQYANLAGINFVDRNGSPTMNLTITGNTIANPGTFGSWGVLGEAGANSGPPADSGTVCAAISGNSMTGSGQGSAGVADFELDQGFSTTIKLPGYTGGSQNTSAVVGFVQGNNTSGGTPTGSASVSGSGGGFTGGTSCPAPS